MPQGMQEVDGPWCILAPPPLLPSPTHPRFHTTPYGTTTVHIPELGNGHHSQYWLTGASPRSLIYSAKELGARRVVEAVPLYALNRMAMAGDLMVYEHLLDLTYGEHSTFFVDKGYGFIQQNPPYCPELRTIVLTAARTISANIALHERPRIFGRGTCAAIRPPLPPVETLAEAEYVRTLQIWGADVVTDGVVPTCFLARELELCYAAIGYVVASIATTPSFPHDSLPQPAHPQTERGGKTARLIQTILTRAQRYYSDQAGTPYPTRHSQHNNASHKAHRCGCEQTMRTARERGDVDDDWHTWIAKPV